MNITSLLMIAVLQLSGPDSGSSVATLSAQPERKVASNDGTQILRTNQTGMGSGNTLRPRDNSTHSTMYPQNPEETSRTSSGSSYSRDGGTPLARVTEAGIEVRNCVVKIETEVTISGSVSDRIVELRTELLNERYEPVIGPDGKPLMVELKRGTRVRAGQVLGRQFDDIQRWQVAIAEKELKVAQMEADKMIEKEYAQSALDVAEVVVQKDQAMNKAMPGTVTEMQMMENKLKLIQAEKQLEKTEYELIVQAEKVEVTKTQLSGAKTQLAERRIISPINGEIADIDMHVGERCREGEKILRIISLDKLQIASYIDANRFTPGMLIDRSVTVVSNLVDGSQKQFAGKVVFASSEVQTGAVFEFVVEVQNQQQNGHWLLRPGTKVDILIQL